MVIHIKKLMRIISFNFNFKKTYVYPSQATQMSSLEIVSPLKILSERI